MTGSPQGLPTRRDTGTDERPAQSPSTSRSTPQHLPRRPYRAPNGAGLKALAAATRSRSARTLTPTPRFGASTNRQRRSKNGQEHHLTGPAPSGMTCAISPASFSAVPFTSYFAAF